MSAPLRFSFPGALLMVCLALPTASRSAEPPAPDKPAPAETKKVELPRLTNEELLKQADAIYDKASRDYLAQLRALAAAEAMLDDARRQTDEVTVPPPSGGPPAGEDAAKKAVEAARSRQDAVRRRLKLVQSQKEALDRVGAALEACQSSAVAFINALDDLKAYALEINLRVKDGSLAEDRAPPALKGEFLYRKKRDLNTGLAGLKTKSADVQKGQEAIARLLEETNKAALAADADVVEAARNLAREQQRQELEKTHAGKKPDELIAELARMVEEGIGLKGTYELALRKFDSRATAAGRLRKELEALRQPDTKVPQLTRAEDVETAAKSIQELIGFHASRVKKIEDLRTALAGLVREGGEFEADAAVSEEHLFKMQVLANLLRKNGVADEKLPARARAAELDPAAGRQKKSAAAVRATTEKAKAELALLDRQLAEAGAAREAAARQLANLKESQDVTLAALKWQGRLQGMTAPQVVETFTATRKELEERLAALKGEAEGYDRAAAAAAEAKARLDGLKDPFLRAAEEQGAAERQKLLAELRKEAGLERVTREATAPVPAGEPKKEEPVKPPAADTRTEMEKAADRLLAFQQLLAGRVRVLDERAAKKKELLAALDELEKKAAAYSKMLADARLLALQANATAAELKKRLGMGELAGDAVPEGVTDALRLEARAKLDATATAVLNALAQLQQDRDRLLRPDPDGEALATATRELLTVVGKRLDLLADLKRLAADVAREKSARPPSEVKRLEQLAAERQEAEASGWDALLGIDSSKTAKNLAELLETYYRELIEIEEKEESLKKQREKVEQLVELTRQETAALARVMPLLARQVARLEAAREEEAILARARLRPERAEELLAAYQTKTGRLLPRPAPLADRDRPGQVEEMGEALFERYVALEAAKKWDEVLTARGAAAAGLKAEAGAYQDELARLNAASEANARRVQALTGREGGGAATGGEIGRARAELARVRTHGVTWIGLKIGGILLAAFLLPWLLLWVLRRLIARDGEEDSSLVLSAFRTILKATVWVTAVAMILSVLGFDVTAIIAGLGIGGLALGLAAQSVIADVIGAVVIFAERRFKIGDVIRLEGADPGRVVGLTWRATQVQNADGLVVTIPNRKVTEATIENLTRAGGTYDSLSVSVITRGDADRVLAVIRRALAECEQVAAEHGVSVQEFNQKGETKTIKYRFWWFVRDYEARNKTRDEVFARIGASLAHEDMAGTEISLA
jgi:small-conductance mechanosensitive channel